MNKCDNCPQSKPDLKICQAEIHSFEREEIQMDLLSAIKEFYKKDFDLLLRDVNEVCITCHIFHYFSMLHAEKYKGYNIDPEYNRNGFGSKYYYGDNCGCHYAKPDLIIHKRNCNKYNLLYVEFKTLCLEHVTHDQNKILRFISNEFGVENKHPVKPYRFKYGVSVLLCTDKVDFLWYKNGSSEPVAQYVVSVKDFKSIKEKINDD